MSSLSEETRQKVRQKARNRCEYCLSHQDYVMGRLQIDRLENSAFWSAVHSRLIAAIAQQTRQNRKVPGVFSNKASTDV